jgi:hypothetical protein
MNEIEQLKKQLDRKNVAFLFGNGINRYNDNSGRRSWEGLLLDLHNRYSEDQLERIPASGINFTEFYDLLLLNNKRNVSKKDLQKEFVSSITNWAFAGHHASIMEKIMRYDCPVLTTNFDDLLPRSISAKKFSTLESSHSGFTDYYPWQCYYAAQPLNKKGDGFAIWFLHGMWNYSRSIKLGLNDYVGNLLKAKDLLPIRKAKELFFKGENTWMKPFLSKSLCIIGLGLDEQEMFLRWLLLQRALNMKRGLFPKSPAWYFTGDQLSEGKILFLKRVGVEPVICKNYKFLYHDLWEKL